MKGYIGDLLQEFGLNFGLELMKLSQRTSCYKSDNFVVSDKLCHPGNMIG